MKDKKMFFGFFIVLVGILLGLDGFGILKFSTFAGGWWTLAIIIPCVAELIIGDDKAGGIFGLFAGVWILLCARNILHYDEFCKVVLPLLFVMIGVRSIIFKKKENTDSEEG